MHGKVRQFLADGPLHNVDLRSGFVVGGKEYVLVAATEWKRFGIMTYLPDPETLATKPYGFIPTGEEFRSEEHTSELQSLLRISYTVFFLQQTNHKQCKT